MADFKAQVEGLTSLTVSTTPTTTELTQFLTDGAKEIINILPANLQRFCISKVSFNSVPAGNEVETLNTGKIFSVFANSVKCRLITNSDKYKAEDSDDILYATTSDPAYYIGANFINILPSGLSGLYEEVQYPAVAHGDSSISSFPDEAEYLVVLYASLKTLLAAIGNLEIPPNVTDEDANTASLTDDIDEITGGQVGADDDFENFNKWFTALGEMIEDDEDIELAGAQIEKINSYVNTWNIQLQGNLAEMQQYMNLFQILKADYISGISMITGQYGVQPATTNRQSAGRRR